MNKNFHGQRTHELRKNIEILGQEIGFDQVGFASTYLEKAEARLISWLDKGHDGDMHYMRKHGFLRTRPRQLIPGTISIVCVRLDYLPPNAKDAQEVLDDPQVGYISRYALGSDYHRILRRKLQRLAYRMIDTFGPFGYRVFCDSAPVLEKPLAQAAGLGWQGKHTVLINPNHGSWFFLGEIFTDLPLIDNPQPTIKQNHCGSCTKCMAVCPTQAITSAYTLDARRCISYLTIEHKGTIPKKFRPLIGNRIFGCDDCQLVCPWNRFARTTRQERFHARHGLDSAKLVDLFCWTEEEFLEKTTGSPLRRLGHTRWLRNISVALGNADHSPSILKILRKRLANSPPFLAEHIAWAIDQQERKHALLQEKT